MLKIPNGIRSTEVMGANKCHIWRRRMQVAHPTQKDIRKSK
jgi:hypothetical protein